MLLTKSSPTLALTLLRLSVTARTPHTRLLKAVSVVMVEMATRRQLALPLKQLLRPVAL
jgi:hypothetical protein